MGITFKQFAYLINPEAISDSFFGGVKDCPGFLVNGEPKVTKCDEVPGEETCGKCWNREMPYTVIAEAISDTDSLYGCKVKKGEKFKLAKIYDKNYLLGAFENSIGIDICGELKIFNKEDFKFYIKKEEKKMNKFEVGQKVRVKKYDVRPGYWNMLGEMDKYMGQIVTIKEINGSGIKILEDVSENNGDGWSWDIENFDPLQFAKDDMKDGMMVETRNGNRYLWLYGGLRRIDSWCSGTQDDFTNDSSVDFDIMKVGYPDVSLRYPNISCALKSNFKEIIWERHEEPETKEISSDEAFRILKEHYGCDVKIKE